MGRVGLSQNVEVQHCLTFSPSFLILCIFNCSLDTLTKRIFSRFRNFNLFSRSRTHHARQSGASQLMIASFDSVPVSFFLRFKNQHLRIPPLRWYGINAFTASPKLRPMPGAGPIFFPFPYFLLFPFLFHFYFSRCICFFGVFSGSPRSKIWSTGWTSLCPPHALIPPPPAPCVRPRAPTPGNPSPRRGPPDGRAASRGGC